MRFVRTLPVILLCFSGQLATACPIDFCLFDDSPPSLSNPWSALALRAQTPGPEQKKAQQELAVHVLDLAKKSLPRFPRPEDREDAIQEGLLRVMMALPQFDPSRNFDGWCYRVLINEGNRVFGREKRAKRVGMRGYGGSLEENSEEAPHLEPVARPDIPDAEAERELHSLDALKAFFEQELAKMVDPARQPGEKEPDRAFRNEVGRQFLDYLAGESQTDIADRAGMIKQTVALRIATMRRKLLTEAVKKGLLPEHAFDTADETLVSLFRSSAGFNNEHTETRTRHLIQREFLAKTPHRTTLHFWEALEALEPAGREAMQALVEGKMAEPNEVARTASAEVRRLLAEREWAEQTLLPQFPAKRYADYLDAVRWLSPERRLALQLRAEGKTAPEIAEAMGKKVTEVATLLENAQRELFNRLTPRVHDVQQWANEFLLDRYPGKSLADLHAAVTLLPEPGRTIVQALAAGKSREQICRDQNISTDRFHSIVKTARITLASHLSDATKLKKGSDWLKEWALDGVPNSTEKALWDAVDQKLDTRRRRAVRMRYEGKKPEEIAKELGIETTAAEQLLSSAKVTLQRELRAASAQPNPYAPGSRDAWAFDFVLGSFPEVPPERFWKFVSEKLNDKQRTALQLASQGKTLGEIGAALGLDTDKKVRTVLHNAKVRLEREFTPAVAAPWIDSVKARLPKFSEDDIRDVFDTLPEQQRTAAEMRDAGKDNAAIAAALGITAKKVTNVLQKAREAIERKLTALPSSGKRWANLYVLDRFPSKTLDDFDRAVAKLPDETDRKILAMRLEGKSYDAISTELNLPSRECAIRVSRVKIKIAKELSE